MLWNSFYPFYLLVLLRTVLAYDSSHPVVEVIGCLVPVELMYAVIPNVVHRVFTAGLRYYLEGRVGKCDAAVCIRGKT